MASKNVSIERIFPIAIERIVLGVRYEPYYPLLDHIGELSWTQYYMERILLSAQMFFNLCSMELMKEHS